LPSCHPSIYDLYKLTGHIQTLIFIFKHFLNRKKRADRCYTLLD